MDQNLCNENEQEIVRQQQTSAIKWNVVGGRILFHVLKNFSMIKVTLKKVSEMNIKTSLLYPDKWGEKNCLEKYAERSTIECLRKMFHIP